MTCSTFYSGGGVAPQGEGGAAHARGVLVDVALEDNHDRVHLQNNNVNNIAVKDAPHHIQRLAMALTTVRLVPEHLSTNEVAFFKLSSSCSLSFARPVVYSAWFVFIGSLSPMSHALSLFRRN
jgi:hypothetical protein